ncbi:MAG: SAM hydrolase/SAM-dependent halogenase family protein [Candidatus Rokuibacteriota bacterium]
MRRRGRRRSGRTSRPVTVDPEPSGIVTLLSDFGLEDPYVGVVKGVILGINPAARLVDLTHAIPPQDVRRAALALEGAYRSFPPGTVHLAVVDPGVGTARRPLLVRAGGHHFVGPDNGLLGFLFDLPGTAAVAPTASRYHGPAVSRTFHARDVFAPVAAHCSRGVPLARFGPRVVDPARLPWPRARREGRRVRGEVLLADRFGNLLTNVGKADLPGPDARWLVEIGGTRIAGLAGTYADVGIGSIGAVIDSSGRLEVFVREGSARERLGIGPGAPVSLWAGTRSASSGSRRPSSPSPSRRSSSPRRSPSTRSPSTPRPSHFRPSPTGRPSSPPPSPSSGTPRGSP